VSILQLLKIRSLKADRYFRMSLYTESIGHIRFHNNSQIRHRFLQFILRSTKRTKTDGEQKTICPSLYSRRDPSQVDKSKESSNRMFILLLRMASLGKWTKDFNFIFLFALTFAFPETHKGSVLFFLYTSHSILQGESFATGPKLLSIKNYVIEIMA